jgi:predicted membrane protein
MIVVVAIVLILFAFVSLFLDSGFIEVSRYAHIILDILLLIFSLIILVRSIILVKIGEKEMLSKKVRDLEARVDVLTKKEEERMKFSKTVLSSDVEGDAQQ